jgi:hypothetical protein
LDRKRRLPQGVEVAVDRSDGNSKAFGEHLGRHSRASAPKVLRECKEAGLASQGYKLPRRPCQAQLCR